MNDSKSLKTLDQLNLLSPSRITRKGLERLDFLLILIEAIEINGVHSLIMTSKDIGLEKEFSNSVELWKTRSHNHLRKAARRGKLSKNNIKSLIILVSNTADRLYPLLRQLLSDKEPTDINIKRWDLLNSRFRDLIYERMNTKRILVKKILNEENPNVFLRELVLLLSFSSGGEGINRLCTYLNDIN